MPDKLTDKEIVNDAKQVTKALEYCVEGDCEKCPYDEQTACNEYLKLDAVKVINRLQAENKDLLYKLTGVMHSVDKWLDGDELKQDEVNRASTMREKTLQIVENLQAENEARQAYIDLLKAENERLKKSNEMFTDIGKMYSEIKAEAYKEFAERLKKHTRKMQSSDFSGEFWDKAVLVADIDNLLKKLVGEDNA